MARTFPMQVVGSRRTHQFALWALAVVVGVAFHGATGHDDSHITYWAAHTLAEYGRILNYNGDAVEQSSSLLHTVVLAVLYRVTRIPIPDLGYGLSIACWGLAASRVVAYLRRAGIDVGRLGLAVVAFSPMLTFWGLGGLETTLYAWLLLESSFVLLRPFAGARVRARDGLVLVATVACRPEAPVLLGSVAAALWGAHRLERVLRPEPGPPPAGAVRGLAIAGAWIVAATAALTAWRLAVFGVPFPAPVVAKMASAHGDRWARFLDGARYLVDGVTFADLPLLVTGFVVATIVAVLERGRWDLRIPVLVAGAQIAAAWATGGDWMIGARFWAHAVPLLYVCLLLVAAPVLRRGCGRRLAFAGVLALHGATTLHLARRVVTSRPAWVTLARLDEIRTRTRPFAFGWSEIANPVHLRDALFLPHIEETVERLLQHKDTLTLSSGQAGMVIYHLALRHFGRIRFVDRHGLSVPWPLELRREVNAYSEPFGVHMPMSAFLEVIDAHPELRPDAIFEIRAHRIKAARAAGFRRIYEQKGRAIAWVTLGFEKRDAQRWKEMSKAERKAYGLRRPPPRFFGKSFELYQALAVDAALAKKTGLEGAVVRIADGAI